MRRLLLFTMLIIAAGSTAAAKEMYIPIAGYAQGANGTYFRTDVRIFNPESRPIAISLHFMPAGGDGRNYPGTIVTLGPREMLVLDNIVKNFFGWQSDVLGAIWLDSWHGEIDYEFTADSRTYTNTPSTGIGTYGQFIPAFEKSTAKKKTVVLHLSNDPSRVSGFRANAGVMNPSFEEALVVTSLHAADGSLLGRSSPWTLPPNTVIQRPIAEMAGLPSVELADGYLVVESTIPVFTYGSIVDNVTSDQMFVAGVEDIPFGNDIVIDPACENPAPLHLTPFAAEGWIVVFNDGINAIDETTALADRLGFTASYIYSGGGFEGFFADLTAETIAALRCEASVRYVQQNGRGYF